MASELQGTRARVQVRRLNAHRSGEHTQAEVVLDSLDAETTALFLRALESGREVRLRMEIEQ